MNRYRVESHFSDYWTIYLLVAVLSALFFFMFWIASKDGERNNRLMRQCMDDGLKE